MCYKCGRIVCLNDLKVTEFHRNLQRLLGSYEWIGEWSCGVPICFRCPDPVLSVHVISGQDPPPWLLPFHAGRFMILEWLLYLWSKHHLHPCNCGLDKSILNIEISYLLLSSTTNFSYLWFVCLFVGLCLFVLLEKSLKPTSEHLKTNVKQRSQNQSNSLQCK